LSEWGTEAHGFSFPISWHQAFVLLQKQYSRVSKDNKADLSLDQHQS